MAQSTDLEIGKPTKCLRLATPDDIPEYSQRSFAGQSRTRITSHRLSCSRWFMNAMVG